MKIEKTFTVAASQSQVWDFITTPEIVAPCIPGCEGAEQIADNQYKASITTKIGPVKATFHVNIETLEERPPEFAKYQTAGEEGSKASRIKATSTLALKQLDAEQTEVSYASDINIMGRLGKFGSGMMNKVADSVGQEFVNKLKEELEQKNSAPASLSGSVNPPESVNKSAHPFNWKIASIIMGILVIAGLFHAVS